MSLKMLVIPVTAFMQNCSILFDSDSQHAVIIDPGDRAADIQHLLDEHHLQPQAIWLTHGHIDHVGAALELSCALNLDIYGPHQEDLFWLDALPEMARRYHMPPHQAFQPQHWLEEGQELRLDEHVFQVLHVPGHTPGSLVFYNAAEKLLFSGDVLFQNSIGRTDFPRGDHETLLQGIRGKLFTLPDDVVVLPGHGSATTIGDEKRHNPFVRTD